MAFDALNKMKSLTNTASDLATQKTVQLLSDLNLVLGLLPDAGYEVGEMEVALGLTPKVTIALKLGRAANEARLKRFSTRWTMPCWLRSSPRSCKPASCRTP